LLPGFAEERDLPRPRVHAGMRVESWRLARGVAGAMRDGRSVAVVSMVGVALLVAACSSSTRRETTSGVTPTKKVDELTPAEAATLCDYVASLYGGYGATSKLTCDGGVTSTTTALPSQAACVDGLLTKLPAGCPATVSDTEACFGALAVLSCDLPARLPPSCALFTEAQCGSALQASTTAEGVLADAGTRRDGSAGSTCPGNTKQTAPFGSSECQSALEQSCCAELTACFDIVAPTGESDCNTYSGCLDACRSMGQDTPCQAACEAKAPTDVKRTYAAITNCANAHVPGGCQ
jgi:hypothetical protein